MAVYTTHQNISTAETFTDEDLFQVSSYSGTGAAIQAGAGAQVTVNGSTFSGNSATSLGGAIYTNGGAVITIGTGTLFENNYGGSAGGAIYQGQSLNYLTIDGATFTNNKTNGDGNGYNGGAIYNDNRNTSVVTLSVSNSTFTNNDATARTGRGGAIDSWGNNYTENCLFANNIAVNGGVINLYGNAVYEDKGSVYSGNTATNQAGVMWNRAVSATFTGSTFTGNYTPTYGAVFYTGNGGSPVTNINDCVFIGNTSGQGGGAILAYLGTQNITGGTVADNYAGQYGGGLFNQNSIATINGGLFKNNSGWVGGGIFNWTASTMTITGTTVTGNTGRRPGAQGASAGGIFNSSYLTMTDVIVEGNVGEYGAGVGNESGALTVVGGTFTGNVAVRGGGIWSNHILASVDGSTFTNNTASIGAGIFALSGGGTPITISNAIFTDNTAGDAAAVWAGAGVYLGPDIASASITDCVFLDNLGTAGRGAAFGLDARSTASVAGGTFARNTNTAHWGGAIFNGGVMTISDVLFDENSADASNELGYGGAIFNGGIMDVSNSTFTNNFANANQGGAAIYHNNGCTLTVSYSDFVGNTSDTKGGAIASSNAAFTVTNCVFIDNTAEKHGGALSNTNGNITVTDCFFSGNKAELGGAICVGGTVFVNSCSFDTEDDSIYAHQDVVLTGMNIIEGNVRGYGAMYVSGGTSALNAGITDFATLEIASDGQLDLKQNGLVSDTLITNNGQLNADLTPKWTYKQQVVLNGINSLGSGLNLTIGGETITQLDTLLNEGNQIFEFYGGNFLLTPIAQYVDGANNTMDYLVDETKTNFVCFNGGVNGTMLGRTLDRDLEFQGNGIEDTSVTAGVVYAGGNSLKLQDLSWTGTLYGGVKDGTVSAVELELNNAKVSKDIYGAGVAANDDLLVEGDVVANLGFVYGEKSYYAAGYANGGDISVDGKVITWIYGGQYKNIYGGANMSVNAVGNTYSVGGVSLTIEEGEFSGIVGNGGFVRAGQSSVQGDSYLEISGGTFNGVVYGGAFAYGTGTKASNIQAGTATVDGNISINITGGTFNADVIGGSIASNSHIATANTSITGSVTITLDASTSSIALNGNLYAGSLGKGAVGGETLIYVKGTDQNLTFGSDSWITGTSEYGNTVHGYVAGNKILAFNEYTGNFTAHIGNGAFDRVTVALASTVTMTNAECDMVSTWRLFDDSFIGGNLSADALDLTGDSVEVKTTLTTPITEDTLLLNSATGLTWDSTTSVKLYGEAAAATATDGVWESEHYRLTATAAGTLTVGVKA